MAQMKVCHLTSVHSPFDPRIFYKECQTLAKAGFNVTIVAPHNQDEGVEGVKIIAVPKPSGRLKRVLKTVWQIYRKALKEKAHVYHFHDPELIPVGLLLKLVGNQVVYDVHEDYVTSIKQKKYLPALLRPLFATLFGLFEKIMTRPFKIILAEKYYKQRFPRGTPIVNYPLKKQFASLKTIRKPKPLNRLVYTGNITEERGALIHTHLVNLISDIEVHLIGRCSKELAEKLLKMTGENSNRLHIEGIECFVPYNQIIKRYQSGNWLAGLAIFPPTSHYVNKELTKFFEYMATGIPTICSNFPTWETIIKETQAGLCVDPTDFESIVKAIKYLMQKPEKAIRMGQNGRLAVMNQYNWENESKKLLAFYRQLEKTKAQQGQKG
jgi:glycosyltransferase involved in cell wall biosynthesis